MCKRIYKTGDYVFEGCIVPENLVISEQYYEDDHTMTITYSYKGTPYGTISFKGICEEDPLYRPLSREQMRKIIVSGFINHYVDKKDNH